MHGLILSPTPITITDGRSLRLRRHARALLAGGYRLTVLAPDLEPRIDGADLVRSPRPPTNISDPTRPHTPGWSEGRHVGDLIRWLPLLSRVFQRLRPEIVVLPTFAPEVISLAGLLFGRLGNCRVVYDYDDPLPENGWAKKGWGPGSLGWSLHSGAEWVLVRHSDRVVVTNRPMFHLLRRATRRRDHLLVFNSPLPTDPLPPPNRGPIGVGYLGFLQPSHRGLEQLLDCWAAMDETSRPLLTLIGGGPSADEFQQTIDALDLSSSVEITGHLNQAGVREAMTRCHYTIIPYPLTQAHHHALPTKLFESVAHGRPVIVPPLASLAGLPEEWFVTYDGTAADLINVVEGLAQPRLEAVDLGRFSDEVGTTLLTRLYRRWR